MQFCEDLLIPKKTIKLYPNNKAWVTPELKKTTTAESKKRLSQSGGTKADIKEDHRMQSIL